MNAKPRRHIRLRVEPVILVTRLLSLIAASVIL